MSIRKSPIGRPLFLTLLLCGACGAPPSEPEAVRPETATTSNPQLQVARGGDLVRFAGCSDCHTPMKFDPELGSPVPDLSRAFSGHPQGAPDPSGSPGEGDQAVIGSTFTSFRLPFGVVYAANLTPDEDTGLGKWTREEFIRSMRNGHRRGDGRAILPPMPWQNLSQQSDEDLEAVYAYLRSLPAIRNRVPEPQVPAEVIAGIAASYEKAGQRAESAARKDPAL